MFGVKSGLTVKMIWNSITKWNLAQKELKSKEKKLIPRFKTVAQLSQIFKVVHLKRFGILYNAVDERPDGKFRKTSQQPAWNVNVYK